MSTEVVMVNTLLTRYNLYVNAEIPPLHGSQPYSESPILIRRIHGLARECV